MVAKLANRRIIVGLLLVGSASLSASRSAVAGEGVVQNPNFDPSPGPVIIDLSPDAKPEHRPRFDTPDPAAIRFDDLDDYQRPYEPPDLPEAAAALPEGMAQVGSMVVPQAMLDGAEMVGDADLDLMAEPRTSEGFIDDVCAFPDQVPPGIYDYDYRPGMELPRYHTIYLNFVGATLMTGGENAAENMSGIARSGHPFPPYSAGETSAIAVAQAIAQDLEQWAINVVYLERPPKVLPYSMVMIGGNYSDTTSGPSGGVAPLDCEDFGQRNVCYAFQNPSVTGEANVASQEIGHTMGLEHSTAPDSVMALGYAFTQQGDLGFNGDCYQTISAEGQGTGCNGVNRCHCGDPDQQNDVTTLSAIFLPSATDVVPPTIDLISPLDGEHFLPEDPITAAFDPWDDAGGFGWKLIVENEAGEVLVDQVDYERALEFTLGGFENGTYTFTALIMDHGGNVATDSVTITVGPEPAGTGTSGGSDGGDGTASDGNADGGSGDGSGDGTGSTGGQSVGDEGCSCIVGDDDRSPRWAWLGLVLFGVGRRRRARVSRA